MDGRTDGRTMENLPEGHKNWDTYFCTKQIGHTQRNVNTNLGKDKIGDPSHMSCTICGFLHEHSLGSFQLR